MMYDQMKDELIREIKDLLPETYKVLPFEVFKNGKKQEAICITEEDSGTSPTYYVDNCFMDYKNGFSIETIARKIIKSYFEAIIPASITLNNLKDFNTQKEKIVYKIVNPALYADQLPYIPHRDFFDLSIVYYCIIEICNEGCMSYMINNNILNLWGIDEDELHRIATENMPKILPPQIMTIDAAIMDTDVICPDIKAQIAALPFTAMYIASNIFKQNGFANILCPSLLKSFGEKFGSFYILPSSVNEAIFIPSLFGMAVDDMKSLVKGVNDSMVGPDIFLSNSVYFYNAKSEKISANM